MPKPALERRTLRSHMSDAIFIVIALLFEFAGPVLLVGLLIWGIRKFMRIRRLRRSLRATKGDAAARQMEYARIRAGVISFLGWAILPVVLAAALSLGMEWGNALTCAALCGGVILYGSLRLKSRYGRDFKEKVVRPELEKVFDNLSFQPDGGLGADVLRSSELLPPGRIECHDLITARYHGLDFSQCDIRIQDGSGDVTTTEDSQEGGREVPADVFQGRVMRFTVSPPVSGPVLVVRRDFSAVRVLSNPGSWQLVETELAALQERFEIFAHDPLDAMRIMTPQMLEGMYYLDQKLDVPLAFHFENGEMLVFMALTRDAFDVSGQKTLLEERKLLEKDISLIRGFLDTMYFRGGRRPLEGEGKEGETRETAASEAVSAAHDTAGLSLSDRLSRLGIGLQKPMRLLCQIVFWFPAVIWGISAAAAFLRLPDGIGISFSITDGTAEFTDSCSTFIYIVVGAFFILPSAFFVGSIMARALNVFLLGGGSGIQRGSRILRLFRSLMLALFAGIPLWLHLFIININLGVL